MAELQMLLDMGFSKEKAERALLVTNNKGVEPAMEWLLAHVDDDLPSSSQETTGAPASGSASAVAATSSNDLDNESEATTTSSSPSSAAGAKSIRCEDCNKLFTEQSQVEYHAVKTGHNNFSESTEEKKPLTDEEKKAQLNLIEEKLKQKRAEREERERKEELEREKNRIRSGKDLTEAKKRMEEQEMLKMVEQRKREKAEEKAARERIRAKIEADKEARRAKQAGGSGDTKPIQSAATSTTPEAQTPPKPQKDYTKTRIQIRLQDGRTLTETFSVKEQLSAVRVFIQIKQGTDVPFGLMTNFPRKVFIGEDFDKPLEALGLVPSAVLIVTKAN